MAPRDNPPPVTDELVSWLEQVFPDRLPDAKCRIRDVFLGIGQQMVLRKLRQVHKQQHEQTLSGQP